MHFNHKYFVISKLITMRQKITLISLMLLVAAFAFGQNAPELKHVRSNRSNFEKHLNTPYSYERRDNSEWAIRKNKYDSQKKLLESTQITNQRLDSLISQAWDKGTSQWVASHKYKYTYDANGNMTQEIYYKGGGDSQFVTYEKYECTYDANSNMTQKLYYYEWWGIGGQLIADFAEKHEYIYDTNGNMIQELDYCWDESTSQWVAYQKYEYTHDANGNLTQEFYYDWDKSASQWGAHRKFENIYDANGNLTQCLGYGWDESTSQWFAASYKYECTYDANGNIIQDLEYEWDESASKWFALRKHEYTYNANGNMTQEIYYDWVESTSLLVAYNKYEGTYDANGNMTQEIYYIWDESTSQLVTREKHEYTYDLSYKLSNLILPKWFKWYDWFTYNKSFFVNKQIKAYSYRWNATDNTFVQDQKNILYYSEQNVTNVDKKETENMSLYPNPAKDKVFIQTPKNVTISKISVYTFSGQWIREVNAAKAITEIDISDLAKGIYFIKCETNKGIRMAKLIKQ
jgi:hypothetical protein